MAAKVRKIDKESIYWSENELERLILMIQNQEEIWDKGHPAYMETRTNRKAKIWQMICEEFVDPKKNAMECQRRWGSLR